MHLHRFCIRPRITAGLALIHALAVRGTAQDNTHDGAQGGIDGTHNAA